MKHYSCLVGAHRFYDAALVKATPLSTLGRPLAAHQLRGKTGNCSSETQILLVSLMP